MPLLRWTTTNAIVLYENATNKIIPIFIDCYSYKSTMCTVQCLCIVPKTDNIKISHINKYQIHIPLKKKLKCIKSIR